MKTTSVNQADIEREWYLVDLEGRTVGRVASKIASILRGKHKPTFTPNVDAGDHVVVVNAEKVVFTGRKLIDKVYYRHSHHPGGMKTINAEEMLEKYPERVIKRAVKGMLPKSRLGRQMLKKLKVYTGPEHPHDAQNLTTLELD
jgi:large subunit ribosomal protein L13